MAAQRAAREAIAQLKAERERQGLSLTDIKARCWIAREVISFLESNQFPNPTVKTLQRYAMALGLHLELSVR
jgi:cytoskeletal protein RodZ